MPPQHEPAAVAAILAEGLDALLGPGARYHLVGFSFGALASGHLAALRSLTLVGAGALGVPRNPVVLEKVRDKAGAERTEAHRANLASLMFADPAAVDDLALAVQDRNSRYARLCSRHLATSTSLRDAVARVRAPLNAIYGELDAIARPMVQSRLDVRPDAATAIIPGAGHWVSFEAAERFDALLVGMLGTGGPALALPPIVVTHGPGTNDDCVADHAMALMLAVLRDIPGNHATVRAGGWREGCTMRPTATGLRLGILGLGEIGARIARRAGAFDMTVAYHNRRLRPDAPFPYVATLHDLAWQSDVLMVATPGGAATRHLVDAEVLALLGTDGFLVNVGRGSVVDTGALVAALRGSTIAGAALDVIEGEPTVPNALRALPNVVLTPHMAGRSPQSVRATIELVLANLTAHFAGAPVRTPVPEMWDPVP